MWSALTRPATVSWVSPRQPKHVVHDQARTLAELLRQLRRRDVWQRVDVRLGGQNSDVIGRFDFNSIAFGISALLLSVASVMSYSASEFLWLVVIGAVRQ